MEHLTRDELTRILAQAKAHRARDWVMILVAFSHGLRASELLSLTPANFADGFVTVQRLKGSNKTTQALLEDPDPLLNERAAVDAWLDRHRALHNLNGARQRLFPMSRQNFWYLMQTYCRRAGIPAHKAHPHVLKHSIAMLTIGSAGIENVRQYLGHKSIASTGSYLKVNDEAASAAIASARHNENFYRPLRPRDKVKV